MEILAMIFALVMLALAAGASLLVGWATGSIWGGIGFALFLIALYRITGYESRPARYIERDELNAFQRPLAEREITRQ